jgi:hypothetical protein
MSKRDVLEVAIKIMGLVSLFLFLGSIAVVAGAIAAADNKFFESKTVYVTLLCIGSFLYLFFAGAFLWQGKRIAEMLTRDSEIADTGERATLPPYARLSFWVRILGLYFFVAVISRLISTLAQAGVTVRSPFWWGMLVGEATEFAIAVVFIFRSEQVSRFVGSHGEQSGLS